MRSEAGYVVALVSLFCVAVCSQVAGSPVQRSARHRQRELQIRTACRAEAPSLNRRAGRLSTKGIVPNSPEAVDVLRAWREKSNDAKQRQQNDLISERLRYMENKAKENSGSPSRGRATPKAGRQKAEHMQRLPSCVATWHAWFKSMDSSKFFETVASRPGLLESYTEDARSEGMAGPQDGVLLDTAEFVKDLLQKACTQASPEVVDLGCGEAGLSKELARQHSHADRQRVRVTSVDAAPLAPGVVVHDLGSLPSDWAGRFDAAVLCRALWGTNYVEILQEARRVLRQGPEARLLVVEPLKRWWGRDGSRPRENGLLAALREAGFSIELGECVDVEPRQASAGVEKASAGMERVFQYVVARPLSG